MKQGFYICFRGKDIFLQAKTTKKTAAVVDRLVRIFWEYYGVDYSRKTGGGKYETFKNELTPAVYERLPGGYRITGDGLNIYCNGFRRLCYFK